METILFYILMFIVIVSALLVVNTNKIYRAVLYLLFVLLGIAGIYFMLDYDFLGAVQLSVYAGGVAVLFIYVVMLTEKVGEPIRKIAPFRRMVAGITVILLMALALYAIWSFDFQEVTTKKEVTIREVGHALLSYEKNGFILAFEVISVILLAAMIGAIVIGKTKKSKS